MTQPTYNQLLDAFVELYNTTSEMVERVGERNQDLDYALSRSEIIMDELDAIGYFKNG